ncbi:hypothetical protein QR98_0043640 [Sarcoptes scabiei]|uniref:Uncharacterized protein n=1 Tax=Sarcoptes scabiei TaxID=52283 RepID=A0A132A4I6_SARSC|nr:hypothetical protein QR98_0043640 [Sarcoptes scabiei]
MRIMFAIAYELGLEELISIIEERALVSMNIDNVCYYLNYVITEIRHKINETLIYLIDSDRFGLDEADVFRSSLEWAKYHTGIFKNTNEWTEQDRKRIQEQLVGVIDKIRTLLIDSKIYAEEVEPTGLIPIELSLERYRFEALTIKLNRTNESDARIQQQNLKTSENDFDDARSGKYFSNSKLLFRMTSIDYEKILNNWYGFDQAFWKLQFRASDHQFSAKSFHQHCDGYGPTIVLILSTKGYLSGGFSDAKWSSGNNGRGRYAASDRSFLFRLHCSGQRFSPKKFPIKKKNFALGHSPNAGPVFGGGADLYLADQCNLNEESYSNLPHSYDGLDADNQSLFGSSEFKVIDYEVFCLASRFDP